PHATGASGTGPIDNANPGMAPIAPKTGGSSANPTPGGPPAIDPSAPTFKRDDTGMAGLDAPALATLKTASGACAVKVTYPYENTLFPGGLDAPAIMWDGAADAAYVRFAYQGSDK